MPKNAMSAPGSAAEQPLRELAELMQRDRADEWAEHGTEAADDRREQRFDRDRCPVSELRIDEEEILHIEGAGRRRERGREGDGLKLHLERIHTERSRGILILADRDEIGAKPRRSTARVVMRAMPISATATSQ